MPYGFERLDSMVLRRAAHSVLEPNRLLLTYVQRFSPSGLRWRDSCGDAIEVEPGALLISHARQEALLELGSATFDEPCDCMQLSIYTELAADISELMGPDEALFCNSTEACIRVLLGNYGECAVTANKVSQVNLFDVDIAPRAQLDVTVAANHQAMAILATGTLQFRDTSIEAPCAIAFSGVEERARLFTQTGASLLWVEWPRPQPTS